MIHAYAVIVTVPMNIDPAVISHVAICEISIPWNHDWKIPIVSSGAIATKSAQATYRKSAVPAAALAVAKS